MAVSKTQNERPAIIDLIDLTSALELASNTHAQNIATLTEGLADEVSDRETADTLLEDAIQAEAEARAQAVQAEATTRAQAVQNVQNQIGDGFTETNITTSLSATNQKVSGILSRLANIKFGATEEITVPANDSYENFYVYPEPFGANSKSFAILGFTDGLLQATLTVTLIDSTYSGFSYSITNTDADPATVNIGYLAIAVG